MNGKGALILKGVGLATAMVVQVAGQNVAIVMLQAGAAPEVNADGNTITAGGQTIKLDNGNLVFDKMPATRNK